MRLGSILTHSITLLVLQQIVSLWFMVDFFLARESTTANKLFNEPTRGQTSSDVIHQIETITNDLRVRLCPGSSHEEVKFDKVILIVIDALGAEFLPSQSTSEIDVSKQKSSNGSVYAMPFLEKSIHQGNAMGFIAKAATPTVTMPRIKALTSGTIPSFMDIVYNLANDVSDFHDDNILRLAKARGKSIVFYGDDTWLSLFDKSMFKRSKETLSLYASDYTTVDTNVTEMALPETKLDIIDWDYLILHYLGLDHIGHVFGTNEGDLISKKLHEMDKIIEEIHSDMTKKDHKTLIVICGDHGMSREGNHGGNTRLETETAMIFMPINQPLMPQDFPLISGNNIYQIDLAVTIAHLTGLPTPSMSRGVLIEQLISSLWPDNGTKPLCAVMDNLVQLVKLLDDNELESPEGFGSRVLHLLKSTSELSPVGTAKYYFKLARDIQTHLQRTVAAKSNPFFVMVTVTIVMLLSIISLRRSSIRLLMPLMSTKERLVCLLAILVPILMQGSTDYIEMENVFWPVFSVTVFGLFCLTVLQTQLSLVKNDIEIFRVLTFTMTFLITAFWNNLGISRLVEGGWSLPVISVLIMCNFSRQTSSMDGKQSAIFYAIGLCIFVTKMVEETSEKLDNHLSQVAMLQVCSILFLALATVANLLVAINKNSNQATSLVQKLATSWMWLVFLLARSRNYVFLISNVVMEASLNSISNSMRFSPIARALMYLQFSTNAFYGQGNTNLFSSLDVKPAFFGQTRYNVTLATILIACSTCGCQIYWYIKLFQRVQGEKEQERMARNDGTITRLANTSKLIPEGTKDAIKDFIDMRNFISMAYYMFVCIVLRNHLFIWSVVSPKLVYLYVTNLILRLTTFMISILPPIICKLLDRSRGLDTTYKRTIE